MRSIKQGICLTKIKKEPTKITLHDNEILTIPLKKHHDVYVRINKAKETIYSDQTGRFPITSIKGKNHIMITYDHDYNAIISRALKK